MSFEEKLFCRREAEYYGKEALFYINRGWPNCAGMMARMAYHWAKRLMGYYE